MPKTKAPQSLYDFLVERELSFENKEMDKEILNNDTLLFEIGELWAGHQSAIRSVLKARIDPIREELVLRAEPPEVMVLRQAIVEIASLTNDFERYAQEADRRRKSQPKEITN